MTFTIEELIREAKRELRKRYQVYPGLVARGNITQEHMDRLIALQQAIIDNLEAQVHAQQLGMEF